MQTQQVSFLNFLNSNIQFGIPIYQRRYSWTREQCQRLWDDVTRAAFDPKTQSHFFGSIVYLQSETLMAGEIQKLEVIDGQQRLTTVSLLLAALARAASNDVNSEKLSEQITDQALTNKFANGEEFYKVRLTKSDHETFKAIIDGIELPENPSATIERNYGHFVELIRKSDLPLHEIWAGVGKLLLVGISLNMPTDDPQLIFESLNSTGLDLSQADLIRNFILMGFPKKAQDKIYNRYWTKMENALQSGRKAKLFNRFIRDYLTMKTGEIEQEGDVYVAFKRYASSEKSIESVVKDLCTHSTYYKKLALLAEEDSDIVRTLKSTSDLGVDVVRPFFLKLYADLDSGLLQQDGLLIILRMTESYIFRRQVCNLNTNVLGRYFAGLCRQVDTQSYVRSVKTAMTVTDSVRRFPKDEEFRREFASRDMYALPARDYLFDKLENSQRDRQRKERALTTDFQVEHIMPQNENLREEWRHDLGDDWRRVHDEYLHTIGNLTLTGYNSQLSDLPFQEKLHLKGGFNTSPLYLNEFVRLQEAWNEERIRQRADELAEAALGIWPFPERSEDEQAGADRILERETRSLEALAKGMSVATSDLFKKLNNTIENFDPSLIVRTVEGDRVVYKTDTEMVALVPCRDSISLLLVGASVEDIDDPKRIALDHKEGVEVVVRDTGTVEDALHIVRQGLEA